MTRDSTFSLIDWLCVLQRPFISQYRSFGKLISLIELIKISNSCWMTKIVNRSLSFWIRKMRYHFKCGRASAEPSVEKVLALRKCNCLNEVSFAFLAKTLLEKGDLTAVKLEASRASFFLLFLDRKRRDTLNKKYLHKYISTLKKNKTKSI